MLVVKGDGNAPFERGSRNAKILKTGLDEVVEHFFFTAFRIDEVVVLLDIVFQLFLILRKPQEVGFFLGFLYLSAAVGTFSVHKLRLGPE